MKLTKLLSTLLVIGLVLGGCKNKKNSDDIVVPIATLYNEGITLLEKKNIRTLQKNSAEYCTSIQVMK